MGTTKCICLSLMLLAGATLLPGSGPAGASSPPRAQEQPAFACVPPVSGAPCPRVWRTPEMSVSLGNNLLYSMVAIAPDDIWIGGRYEADSLLLMLHFDGHTWQETPGPRGMYDEYPRTMAATGPHDVWAAGSNLDARVFHYDGVTWTSTRPVPGSEDYIVTAVDAVAPGDVWAVGKHYNATTPCDTLIVHYDGTHWEIIPSPNPSAYGNSLWDVAAVSAQDIWAAGIQMDAQGNAHTLLLHYDGVDWAYVPSPNAPGNNLLWSLDARAADDVWAVGTHQPAGWQPLTLHYDGASWTVAPTPAIPMEARFNSVLAVAADDAWAVGEMSPAWYQQYALVEHWDGTQWSLVDVGDQRNTRLYAVAAPDADHVYLAGDYLDGAWIHRAVVDIGFVECSHSYLPFILIPGWWTWSK